MYVENEMLQICVGRGLASAVMCWCISQDGNDIARQNLLESRIEKFSALLDMKG